MNPTTRQPDHTRGRLRRSNFVETNQQKLIYVQPPEVKTSPTWTSRDSCPSNTPASSLAPTSPYPIPHSNDTYNISRQIIKKTMFYNGNKYLCHGRRHTSIDADNTNVSSLNIFSINTKSLRRKVPQLEGVDK